MDSIQCLLIILFGMVFWFLSLWIKERYESEWRFYILFMLGMMCTFAGFGELVHYKELGGIANTFAILMGILYSFIVLYAIHMYFEGRKESHKRIQEYLDNIKRNRSL